MQVGGQRIHFAAQIGQLRVAQFRRNDTAAFDAQFQAVQLRGGLAERFVRAVEVVEALRMILFVEPFGTEQLLHAAQRLWNIFVRSRFVTIGCRAQGSRRETQFRTRRVLTLFAASILSIRKCSSSNQVRSPRALTSLNGLNARNVSRDILLLEGSARVLVVVSKRAGSP